MRERPPLSVSFRAPVNADRGSLDPKEREVLREAARIQRALSWARREMELGAIDLLRTSTRRRPDSAARRSA